MSYYRAIDVRIWGDRDFRTLSHRAKLLWLYVLSGPHTTGGPGIWRFEPATAARDLGIDQKLTTDAIEELRAREMLELDAQIGILWVRKRLRYIRADSPDNVRPWVREIASLPECDLRDRALQEIRRALRGWRNKEGDPDARFLERFERELAKDGTLPGPVEGPVDRHVEGPVDRHVAGPVVRHVAGPVGGPVGGPGGGPVGGPPRGPAPPPKGKHKQEHKQEQEESEEEREEPSGRSSGSDDGSPMNPELVAVRDRLNALLRLRPREANKLSRIFTRWVSVARPPLPVVAAALDSTIRAAKGEKGLRSASAYLEEIIRKETPNHHERAAMARGAEQKTELQEAADLFFGRSERERR